MKEVATRLKTELLWSLKEVEKKIEHGLVSVGQFESRRESGLRSSASSELEGMYVTEQCQEVLTCQATSTTKKQGYRLVLKYETALPTFPD